MNLFPGFTQPLYWYTQKWPGVADNLSGKQSYVVWTKVSTHFSVIFTQISTISTQFVIFDEIALQFSHNLFLLLWPIEEKLQILAIFGQKKLFVYV